MIPHKDPTYHARSAPAMQQPHVLLDGTTTRPIQHGDFAGVLCFYAATLRESIHKRAKPTKQDLFTDTTAR